MTTQISHFVNGQRTVGQSKRTADVMNPNTGQVQAKVPMASSADVDAAVTGAAEAQKEWAAWNPQRRARVLMRFIDLVNQNVDELAELHDHTDFAFHQRPAHGRTVQAHRRRDEPQHRRGPGEGADGVGGRRRRRGGGRGRGPEGVGGVEPAAPGPRDDALHRPGQPERRRAGRDAVARAWQDPRRLQGRHPARHRGDRVRGRHPAPDEG